MDLQIGTEVMIYSRSQNKLCPAKIIGLEGDFSRNSRVPRESVKVPKDCVEIKYTKPCREEVKVVKIADIRFNPSSLSSPPGRGLPPHLVNPCEGKGDGERPTNCPRDRPVCKQNVCSVSESIRSARNMRGVRRKMYTIDRHRRGMGFPRARRRPSRLDDIGEEEEAGEEAEAEAGAEAAEVERSVPLKLEHPHQEMGGEDVVSRDPNAHEMMWYPLNKYYRILGFDVPYNEEFNRSLADIKKAYRKRAISVHPDQGGNTDEFNKLKEAYDYLVRQADPVASRVGTGSFQEQLDALRKQKEIKRGELAELEGKGELHWTLRNRDNMQFLTKEIKKLDILIKQLETEVREMGGDEGGAAQRAFGTSNERAMEEARAATLLAEEEQARVVAEAEKRRAAEAQRRAAEVAEAQRRAAEAAEAAEAQRRVEDAEMVALLEEMNTPTQLTRTRIASAEKREEAVERKNALHTKHMESKSGGPLLSDSEMLEFTKLDSYLGDPNHKWGGGKKRKTRKRKSKKRKSKKRKRSSRKSKTKRRR